MIFVARILGREAYGEFGLVRSTAMMFVMFSCSGQGITATKHIAELLHNDKERTGRIIGLSYLFTLFTSVLLAVIFYLLAPWICETQLNQPQLTNMMKLCTLLLFITTFMSTQVSVMTGFQDFRGLAITNGLAGLTMLPIYIVGAYFGGLCGVVIAAIIASALNFMFNSVFIYQNMKKYKVRYTFRLLYKEISLLWTSNVPMTLVAIIYCGMIFIVQMMIGKQHDGIKELGLYYAAMNYQMMVLVLPNILMTTFLPNFCELNNPKQLLQYWKIVKLGLILTPLIATCSALPLLILPNYLMELNGTEFTNTGRILIAVGILGIITSNVNMWGQILLSQNDQWTILLLHIINIVVSLIFAHYLLNYHWGGLGAVFALIIGQCIHLLLASLCLVRYYCNIIN
jgi:O-antigen/teichoic acid export membrane protein